MFQTLIALGQGPPILWQKTFGGSSTEAPRNIQQTSDGGYVVIGSTTSQDGDVICNHPDEGGGCYEILVLKLSSTGTLQWARSLGGSQADDGCYIQETSSGDFILVGTTLSDDGDVSGKNIRSDAWVVKLSSSGNILWQKCYGGSNDDYAYCIRQTKEGGYIFVGATTSTNSTVPPNMGRSDVWVVKLDGIGNIIWQKNYGGSSDEEGHNISQTADGGYVVLGGIVPDSNYVGCNAGNSDGLIYKLDTNGGVEWNKCLGAQGWDGTNEVQQTSDKGYIIAGHSKSQQITTHWWNDLDCWILKLDSLGNTTWQKTYGGGWDDAAWSIKQTSDGGYVFLAATQSNDGDIDDPIPPFAITNCWVVKLDAMGNIIWKKSYGGSGFDAPIEYPYGWFPMPSEIIVTLDGGYAFLQELIQMITVLLLRVIMIFGSSNLAALLLILKQIMSYQI
jgi:hypothetical protein